MGIQINGNTNNINAGIGSLSIEDLNELHIVGVATASNFKTGTSNVHSTGYECTNINAVGVTTLGSTTNANTILASGYMTIDGNINITTGKFRVPDTIEHYGDSDTKIRFPAGDTISFETGGSEHVRIASNGNITYSAASGETTIISKRTNAAGSNGNYFFHLNATDNNDNVVGSLGFHRDTAADDSRIVLSTRTSGGSNTERLRIDSSGNLMLGTSTSIQKFTIDGGGISLDNGWNTQWGVNASRAYIQGEDGNGNNRLILGTNNQERLRIDSTGSLLVANTTGSRTNLNANADDIVIGNTLTSNETGITFFSTSATSLRFNDAAGTDGAIEYAHSARQLRFNAAGADRLIFGVNGNNSPVFSMGTGSSHLNNNTAPDRASVKIGGLLHLEGPFGNNATPGMYYNCYSGGNDLFYRGSYAPSSGDRRPCAYGQKFGGHYFYGDTSSTAWNAQQQITSMQLNMYVGPQGYVTKPNQPSFSASRSSGHVYGGNPPTAMVFNSVDHNVGNNYNNSNGIFTAPIAGKYQFSFCGMAAGGSGDFQVRLLKNGGGYFNNNGSGRGYSTFEPYGFTVLVNMAINDTVQIKIYSSNTSCYIYAGTVWNKFSGHLVG